MEPARAASGGLTVAPYHSGLGRGRAAVYEAARAGDVDVLVGTRRRRCSAWRARVRSAWSTSPTRHTGPSRATRVSRSTSGMSRWSAAGSRAAVVSSSRLSFAQALRPRGPSESGSRASRRRPGPWPAVRSWTCGARARRSAPPCSMPAAARWRRGDASVVVVNGSVTRPRSRATGAGRCASARTATCRSSRKSGKGPCSAAAAGTQRGRARVPTCGPTARPDGPRVERVREEL